MVLSWLYVRSRSRKKAGPTAYAFETNVMGIGFVLQPRGPWNVTLLYFSKFSLDEPFPVRFVKSNLNHFQNSMYPTHQHKNTEAFETHFGKSLWSGPLSILVAESWSLLSHTTGSFRDGWLCYSQDPPHRSLPWLWKTVSLMTTRGLSIPTSSVVQPPPSASQCCLIDSPVHQAQEKRSVQQKPLNSLLEKGELRHPHRTLPPATLN